MAHEIDFSKGYAAMFSVRVPVWHQEETGAKRLSFHPTSAEALIEAGLDFEVVKVPTKRLMPDGSLLDNSLAFSTVRTDTGGELGMVGRDYTPLQNRDALAVFDPLIASGHAVIETAGALRGGADVWVAIAWNLEKFGEMARRVFGDDPRGLLPYSVVRNNHNGRSNVVGMDVTICPVCANTLGMALEGAGVSESEGREGRISGAAFAVKHSSNVKANVEAEAKRMWSDRVALFELVAAQYERLKRCTLQPQAFTRLVLDYVAPDPQLRRSWNPEARLAKVVLERWETKRAELSRMWEHGTGHAGDRSAWEAYNGTVEAIDHNADLWPLRSGVFRTQALLDGELGRLKQGVVNRLAQFAGADADERAALIARPVVAGLLALPSLS
jgi:phage/plasmid-like protein (TIGR03299 family)